MRLRTHVYFGMILDCAMDFYIYFFMFLIGPLAIDLQ